MNLIWCRITAKYLVQNKKQISAKKAENLHLYGGFITTQNIHETIQTIQDYTYSSLFMYMHKKSLKH